MTAPLTVAPIAQKPDLGALRVLLASLSPRSSVSDGVRAAEAMVSAGIEISDDEGNYYEADDLIDKLGGPEFSTGDYWFCEGYWQAKENHASAEDFRQEGAQEGAAFFWNVYRGINRAVECHQWRDLGGPPSDYMRRAAE
jgi:hypothetical protein